MDQLNHSNGNPPSTNNSLTTTLNPSEKNSLIQESSPSDLITSSIVDKSPESTSPSGSSNLNPMNGSGSASLGTVSGDYPKVSVPSIPEPKLGCPEQQELAETTVPNEKQVYPIVQSDSFVDCTKSAFANNKSNTNKNDSSLQSPVAATNTPSFSQFSGGQSPLFASKGSAEQTKLFSPLKNCNQTSPLDSGRFSGYDNSSKEGGFLFSTNQGSISSPNEKNQNSFSINTQADQRINSSQNNPNITSPNLNQRPLFSALKPANTPPTVTSNNIQNTTAPTTSVESPKSSTLGLGLGGSGSGSALGCIANMTSGIKSDSNRQAASTDSTALGKLNWLRGPMSYLEKSTVPAAKTQNSESSLSTKPQNIPPKFSLDSSNSTQSALQLQEPTPNGPFIFPSNQYFGLTADKPIIDNSSEFNYKLPDYLSQPNSDYVKNYVVPKLGSVIDITRKLNAAHIENKSQLDTLDSLSSNIIDLVQNKNMYYGSGQFKDMHLKPELIQGLFEMGYRIPSRIQEATLPIIVNQKRNLVAQSQNGTGKTGAFALALLSNLDPSTNHPEAVVLAPTYELASQTKSVIDKMAKFMLGMSTILGIKGVRLSPGTKINEKIVIGTPGTIADWMTKFRFFDSRLIKMFVLDEADVMISQSGHLAMCSRIKSALPKDCQSLLFSATYPASVCSFANFSVPNATVIRVKSSDLTLDSVKQYYTYVSNQNEQFDFAWNLFTTICISQCIIFCDTRSAAQNLASKFVSYGFKTSVISGEQPVEERAAVIERLRKGKDKVLIATNVVARGIDISTTSLIINFDIPIEYNHNRRSNVAVPNFETYLHRVGRAGRFGVKGICVTVAKTMQDIDLLGQIQAYYNHEIKPIHPWDAEQLHNLDPIKYAMDDDNN